MLHAYFLSVKFSINNVSIEGEGGVSQMLTMTNKGGKGSEMAQIMLTLLMDSPKVV